MDYLRPSPRLWRARRAQVLTAALPVIAAAGFLGAQAGSVQAAAAALVVAVAWGLIAAAVHRRVQSWGYVEREDDLVVTRGLLVRRVTVVPYGRMQFIDVIAGPVERFFKIATVHLHTAAAATDARIPGLDREQAALLRDRLATLGEARAAGL